MKRKYLQDVSIVDFYGQPIFTGWDEESGQFVVPMKHLIEDHMGLEWERQRQKLHDSELYNPVIASGKSFLHDGVLEAFGLWAVEADAETDAPMCEGGWDPRELFNPEADYICLPVAELNLFICQINSSRVKYENVRQNIVKYQKECGQALHDYWMYGAAVNHRENPSLVDSNKKPEDRSPRHWTAQRLIKATERYAKWCSSGGVTVQPEDIQNYVKMAIYQLIDVDDETWEDPRGYVEYIIAFMERAASDILFMCMEKGVGPEELSEVAERNLLHCWENLQGSILAIQSPYSAFPGAGIGADRELV